MDQSPFSPLRRFDHFQRPNFGEAQEFGRRQANWRDLWSQLVQPCPGGISDVELMHSLLCLVLPENERIDEIAQTLVEKHGNFANAISIPLSDHEYAGSFPYPAAVAFKVVHLAAQRLVEREITDRPVLSDQKRLKKYLITTLKHKTIEQRQVLFLDASNRVLADELLAEGAASLVRFDAVDVVRRALNWGAAKIAMAQNFPGANPEQDDGALAGALRLRDLCAALNLIFVDYFFLNRNHVYGLREKGMI